MYAELSSELIFALSLLLIAGVGAVLSRVVFTRSEARSNRRVRRRSFRPSLQFRVVSDWMARLQELRRWRG